MTTSHPPLLHQLLERAAGSSPGHEAVRCGDATLTYEALDRAAGGLAGALRAAGVARADRVGVLLPKSVEALASVYGVMKAGAVYVPMDHKSPVARLAAIANDCAIAALITTPALAAALAPALEHPVALLVEVGEGTTPVDAPADALRYEEAIAQQPPGQDPGVETDDLAYILYTSGSTGTPKGVMLTHGNAMAFVSWAASAIDATHDDRFSSHAPLTFDLSVFDLYVAAFAAATVVMVPEDQTYFGSALATLIERERVSVWYSVPSALALIAKAVDQPSRLATLRAVLFAGEVFPTPQLRGLRALVPSAALWNLYGPTETNVCTAYRVEQLPPDDQTIPIGRACSGDEVFAVRDDGAHAGVGEVGELCVRGPTVMQGYWGRPERTAEVLVADPADASDGEALMYRTGDLVRLRPDGDFEFIGRRDHQIKSRGYRIELGDIEAALLTHAGIADAAVVAVPHERWGNEIVAYVVPASSPPTATAVKRHVLDRLPRYMVPSRVEVVAALPRTLTGKVDRTMLAQVGQA